MLVGYVPELSEPSDDTTVWQYIDFTKLVSILERRELFFVRVDEVDDPYEGKIPNFNLLERILTSKAQYPDLTEQQLQKAYDDSDNYRELLVSSGKILINCWHMNEFESAAMWELYAQRNSGIAIKTTYKRLKDSLDKGTPDLIKFGIVKYIDFEKEWEPEGNLYYPFFHKRKTFEHERELRALTDLPIEGPTEVVKDGRSQIIDMKDPSDPRQKTEHGKYVTVDVDTLISDIYVAPRAQSWIGELVRAVAVRYGLKREQVIKSDLYSLK